MVSVALQEFTIVEPVALFEWRCNGQRRDGRRCTTLLMRVSVDFIGRIERRCEDCKELKVWER